MVPVQIVVNDFQELSAAVTQLSTLWGTIENARFALDECVWLVSPIVTLDYDYTLKKSGKIVLGRYIEGDLLGVSFLKTVQAKQKKLFKIITMLVVPARKIKWH